MKLFSYKMRVQKVIWLCMYYGIGYWLPDSYLPILGKISNWFRVRCAHHIFAKCGNIRTINRKVYFHKGTNIEIGDESGIGANCDIPEDIIIGNNVMISRNVFILNRNHRYDRLDLPINEQGFYETKQTIIEDDVWIGLRSILTPGRIVRKGSIVAMGSVLTKDFPMYSVVGGNPAKLIKSRINSEVI